MRFLSAKVLLQIYIDYHALMVASREKKTSGKKASAKKKPAKREVWERAAPAKAKHAHLSPQKKSAAKARAKRAGRPYPNLVDNMRAARRAK